MAPCEPPQVIQSMTILLLLLLTSRTMTRTEYSEWFNCFNENYDGGSVQNNFFNDDATGITCHFFEDSMGSMRQKQRAEINCTRIGGQKNVIRVSGDYEVMVINCSAPFQLDMDYGGFTPTEAIELSFWKMVTVHFEEDQTAYKISTTRYGLTARITSIRRLFQNYQDGMKKIKKENDAGYAFYQKNVETPISYPRTGAFKFRRMAMAGKKSDKNKMMTLYIFFEEPLLENRPSFIENDETSRLKLVSHSKIATIIVPCRPAHFTNEVTLTVTHSDAMDRSQFSWNLTAPFDPTVGFLVAADKVSVTHEQDLNRLTFKCAVLSMEEEMAGGIKIFKNVDQTGAGVKNTGIYGLSLLPHMKKAGTNVKLHSQVNLQENFSVLRCTFPPPPQNFGFWSHGLAPARTVADLRQSREFSLPIFVNRSYFAQIGRLDGTRVNGYIDRESSHGACFCSSGTEYNFIEYTAGFTGAKFSVQSGTSWFGGGGRRWKSIEDSQIQIRLQNNNDLGNGPLFAHANHTFACQIAGFSLMKPVLWFVRKMGGEIELVFQDNSFDQGTSVLETRLSFDVIEIFCLAPRWLSDDWRRASISLKLIVGTAPEILSNLTSFKFRAESGENEILCEAMGNPPPIVWWEADGQPIIGSEGPRFARLDLTERAATMTNGSNLEARYFCKAKNDLGEREAELKILFESISNSDTSQNYQIPLITSTFLALFVLAGIFLFVYYRRKIRKNNEILTSEELIEFRKGADRRNSNDYTLPSSSQPYDKDFEILPERFTVDKDKVLGSGTFGLVMKGFVDDNPVAVKTVMKGADKSCFKSLLSELKLFIYLGKHPNIVGLVGASTIKLHKGTLYVFVEICDLGNLLHYLRTHRQKFLAKFDDSPVHQKQFDTTVLHRWALEIAQGMAFLTFKKVIHGDLAARNVLLTSDRRAKITDFGLSRQLYENSMYMKQSQEPLPWRWLALETLMDLKFTCESDVWSYGVTLWEIYSLGQVPFPGLSWDVEFVDGLKNGRRLNCPSMISNELYSTLMTPCWANEAEDRPTFDQICVVLREISSSLEEEHEISVD